MKFSRFKIDIPQALLDDLEKRLDSPGFPDRKTFGDEPQHAFLERLHELLEYWRTKYDWRTIEARLNSYPQCTAEIDGLRVQFLHARSKHAEAMPLVMTRGWPGSMVEFLDVIEPLVNPIAFGGKAKDAFHVVLPSIHDHDHDFSDEAHSTCVAQAWGTLMMELGYREYVGHGGGWGAAIATEMERLKLDGLRAVHVNHRHSSIFEQPENLVREIRAAFGTLYETRRRGHVLAPIPI